MLKNLIIQTHTSFKVIVVNDGSTDGTESIVRQFCLQHPQIHWLTNSTSKNEHQVGAKVVEAFNFGISQVSIEDFDAICKFDADIILPDNYLEVISKTLSEDPQIGIIGGHCYIEENGKWVYENIANKHHVRGPIKCYRKACFESIGGLRPCLGWDNLDEYLAELKGWKIKTLSELRVLHLKPTAYKYQKEKALKLGQYFYNMGFDLPLTKFSALKAAWNNRSITFYFEVIFSYLKLYLKNIQRCVTHEEAKQIRKIQYKRLLRKINPFD